MNNPLLKGKHSSRKEVFQSFKAKADSRRTAPEKFADWMTNQLGSVWFLTLNVSWFGAWIVTNTGLLPFIEPFDEFPFGLLTTIVSLEAIFLAIIVLISQNREAKVADLREEIDLQINTIAEEEITKLVELVIILLKKEGINVENDAEITRILAVNNSDMERKIEKELS